MVIWKGYGISIFGIVVVNSLLSELVSEEISHDDDFYQTNLFPLGASFLLSGIIVHFLIKYFEKKKNGNEGTRIFDRVTIAQSGHHLFFIPAKYWAHLLFAIGIGIIIYQYKSQ